MYARGVRHNIKFRGHRNEDVWKEVSKVCNALATDDKNRRLKPLQCQHHPSGYDSDAYTGRLIGDLSMMKNIRKFCRSCTICFAPKHLAVRSFIPGAVNLLAEPFNPSYRLSKFFYHDTDLWKWTVFDLIMSLKTHRNWDSFDAVSKSYAAHWSLCLLQHLPFLCHTHYHFLCHSDLIDSLCGHLLPDQRFVCLETDSYFYSVLILCHITNWFVNVENQRLTSKPRCALSKVKELTLRLKAHWNLDYHPFAVMLENYRRTANMVDRATRALWRRRKRKEKCAFERCSKSKRKSKKWKLCSSCLVAGYCSRRCAKLDWKNGVHKTYCDSYARLRTLKADPWTEHCYVLS